MHEVVVCTNTDVMGGIVARFVYKGSSNMYKERFVHVCRDLSNNKLNGSLPGFIGGLERLALL